MVQADLSPEEVQRRIQKMKRIYADFLEELNGIKKHQNKIINNILKDIDQQKIQHILDQLH